MEKNQLPITKILKAVFLRQASQKFMIINIRDKFLFKPKKPFAETSLEQVAGCLKYHGEPKSLDEMEDAIRKGVLEQ